LKYVSGLLYTFFISFGIVFGAGIFSGLAAIINNHPPIKTINDMAIEVKIWAVAASIGGTFSSVEMIEKGILKFEIDMVIKQIISILIALIGANVACLILKVLQRCGEYWQN